jgi:acyl carrier protein
MHPCTRPLRQFIADNFLFAEPGAAESLGDGDSLIDAGLIDSTGVLELVGFLEQEFGIDVADEDLVPENLDSIARLAAFIDRKRADRVDVSPE